MLIPRLNVSIAKIETLRQMLETFFEAVIFFCITAMQVSIMKVVLLVKTIPKVIKVQTTDLAVLWLAVKFSKSQMKARLTTEQLKTSTAQRQNRIVLTSVLNFLILAMVFIRIKLVGSPYRTVTMRITISPAQRPVGSDRMSSKLREGVLKVTARSVTLSFP